MSFQGTQGFANRYFCLSSACLLERFSTQLTLYTSNSTSKFLALRFWCRFFFLAIVGFLTAGAIMPDSHRRQELFAIAGVGFFVFVLVLLFGYPITGNVSSPAIEKSRLTISELLELADSAENKGNFDRALMHLETVKSRLQSGDSRLEKIEERISDTKDRQVK